MTRIQKTLAVGLAIEAAYFLIAPAIYAKPATISAADRAGMTRLASNTTRMMPDRQRRTAKAKRTIVAAR